MNKLYEIREKLISFYYRFEVFIVPVLKLALTFILIHSVNSSMGYFSKIDNIGIELIVSLLCSFLPNGFILVFAGLFSLLHMYGLSLIVFAVGVVLYLVLYILFFRFAPKASLVVAVTPILMAMKIPYVLPVVLGLATAPGSAVAVACGVVVYYFIQIVNANAEAIGKLELGDAAEQLKLLIDGLIANKGMIIVAIAFAVTVILVYIVRRIPIKRNWELAIIAGSLVDMLILLIGNAVMKCGLSAANIIVVSILAIGVGFIVKFFGFCVDFAKVESVQFEDDEYYYYVKAVPKINLGIIDRATRYGKSKNKRDYYEDGELDEIYDDGIDENYEYADEEGYSEEYYEEGTYYEDDVTYEQDGEYSDGYDSDLIVDDMNEN